MQRPNSAIAFAACRAADMDWNWVDSKMSIRIIKQLSIENGWSGILPKFYSSKIVN